MKKTLTLLAALLMTITLAAQTTYSGKRIIVHQTNKYSYPIYVENIDSLTFETVDIMPTVTVKSVTHNSVTFSVQLPEKCSSAYIGVSHYPNGYGLSEEISIKEDGEYTIDGLGDDHDYYLAGYIYDEYEGGRCVNLNKVTMFAQFHTPYSPGIATIPSGTDLATWFEANPVPDSTGIYTADYRLEAGGQYTLSKTVDFRNKYVRIFTPGDKNATITVADGASFKFGNGIRLENLFVDCTANSTSALLLMSDNTSEFTAQTTEALGFKGWGAVCDGYVMTNPVTLKNVDVKNLKNSLIYGNKTPWSLTDLLIDNCIVQLDNDGSMGVINMYQGNNGVIKYLTVSNSTFYNLKANTSAYFLRYANGSNAQPKKIFGTSSKASLSIYNCTFANVFTGKDFANNLPNVSSVSTYLHDNIFYDVYRVYQIVQTNTERTTLNNHIWWVNTPRQENDITRTDSEGYPICTEADPGFPAISSLKELDFSKANCGADFTPSGTPAEKKTGDPRWLKN